MEAPLSRVEAILQNILGADNVLVPPQSRVEEILLAILNNTEYIHPGDPSRVEEILLAIKDGGSYDKKALSRVEDILIHKLNDEEYTDYSEDDLSRVEKLLIQWIDLHPEVIKELTTSSFPISILANGLPLIDYAIYGNTVQNGTPTPDSPIEPEFVGERTENLLPILPEMLDKSNWNVSQVYFIYYKLPEDIASKLKTVGNISGKVFVKGENITNIVCGIAGRVYASVDNTERLLNSDGTIKNYTHDVSQYNDIYIVLGTPRQIGTYGGQKLIDDFFTNYDINIVSGTTVPTAYEPYGYKIPISSGGQTKNIYLGQVQSTRKIKKLVLTGEENVNKYVIGNQWSWTLSIRAITVNFSEYTCLANTYVGIGSNGYGYVGAAPDKSVFTRIIYGDILYIMDMRFTEVADFKAWLSQQYAAGTPVIVWYVLATPEVGIVNEPLCRIGDYADSVDFEQADVEIPTLKKPNTTGIDVETEVEPSSMYLKYSESSDGPAPKTPVLGTKDREIYVTPNNEIYVLRR